MMVDHITRQQFVQGLSRLGIEVAHDDLEVLLKKYDDDGEGSVNYVAFSRDVDASEIFSDRTRISSQDKFSGGFRSPKVHAYILRAL